MMSERPPRYVRAPQDADGGGAANKVSLDAPVQKEKSRAGRMLKEVRGPHAIVRADTENDFGLTIPEYGEEFKGKRVLISGVSHFGGFGFETAKKLIDLGATVVFTHRTPTDESRAVEAALKERAEMSGGKAISLQADISKLVQAQSLVSRAVEAMKEGPEDPGRLDIYIDNAATISTGMLHNQSPKQVVRDTMTNVVGPQIILGEVVKQMRLNKGGRVVSVLSAAADGSIDQSRYAGSKAYKFGALRSGAMESAMERKKITFVGLAPGLSPTTLTEGVPDKVADILMEVIDQAEKIPAEDVADYMVFASSSHADRFNAQVIPVLKPMRRHAA